MRTDTYNILKELGVSSYVLSNLDGDEDFDKQYHAYTDSTYRYAQKESSSRKWEEDSWAA